MRQPLALGLFVLLAQPTFVHAQSTDDAAAEAAPSKTKAKKKKKGKKDKPSRPTPIPAAEVPADGAPPTPAAAQPAEDEPIPSYDANGEPAGATENPTAKDWDYKAPPPPPVVVQKRIEGYPIERIYRPLVLPRHMMEAGLDLVMTVDPGSFTPIVRGAFGVTPELQVGLRYAAFTSVSGETVGGKDVTIDVDYAIFPWVAAQVSLPINFDPYAQGVVLGAPMKFEFWDKFSIEILRDLVGIKIKRFLPSTNSPAENAGLAAADALNTIVPASEVNLGLRVIYQFKPNLAGEGRYNVRMPEFEADGAPHELTLGGTYSTSSMVDLGLRLGFFDLANASESFEAQLAVAYRR